MVSSEIVSSGLELQSYRFRSGYRRGEEWGQWEELRGQQGQACEQGKAQSQSGQEYQEGQ